MKHEKKIKVVMLATTDRQAPINLGVCKKELFLANGLSMNHRHLYFLSDERIKEGDWVLHKNIYGNFSPPEKVIKVDGDTIECGIVFGSKAGVTKNGAGFYKIIATTNPELNLPRPSNSFIQKFVEEYNSGNIIEEVIVEYIPMIIRRKDNCPFYWNIKRSQYEAKDEHGLENLSIKDAIKFEDYKLKLASDNTITIKPVIETWDDIFDNFLNNNNYLESNWRQFLEDNYNPPTKKK